MRTVNPAIKSTSVKVPTSHYLRIRKLARKNKGTLLINMMAEAIDDYLEKIKKSKL